MELKKPCDAKEVWHWTLRATVYFKMSREMAAEDEGFSASLPSVAGT